MKNIGPEIAVWLSVGVKRPTRAKVSMDKQQELVGIIGYSGHISDFAIRIEREELLYVVWCLARGISQSRNKKCNLPTYSISYSFIETEIYIFSSCKFSVRFLLIFLFQI
jgi:hypothetical protein